MRRQLHPLDDSCGDSWSRVARTYVTASACIAALVGIGSGSVHGQDPDVARLREQIQALQQQLEQMDRPAAPIAKVPSRVTQIGTAPATVQEKRHEVRLYDLSDLFASAPDYWAEYGSDLGQPTRYLFGDNGMQAVSRGMGGGMGGGAGGFFRVGTKLPDDSRQYLAQAGASATTMEGLINTLKTSIAPSSWTSGGGTISQIGNSLVISAEGSVHEQVEAMINLFRQRWGTLRTVSIRAYWLWLDDVELRGLLSDPKAIAAGELPAFGAVDDAAWQKHLDALAAADAKRPSGYRAVITCFNGQTVHTLAGQETLAVTGIRPMLPRDPNGGDDNDDDADFIDRALPGQVAYSPLISPIQEGAALQVSPLSNASGKYLMLDVHSRVTRLVAAPPLAAADPAAAAIPKPTDVSHAIDRPRLIQHRLSTTLRIPVEKTMLVGGMTYVDNAAAGANGHLYLFIKATVQELRDDVPAK